MKALRRSAILAVAMLMILAAGVQEASAQIMSATFCQKFRAIFPILLGTTGACNNAVQGGPCTTTSRLVLLNPKTGALIKDIGPVGYTVNGLAWDPTTLKLYASTAIGCGAPGSACPFHGLITINPFTGKGTPVDPNLHNFGLFGADSPIHSIAVDPFGHMVGWYDEKIPPSSSDTYVRINQRTGVATEFSDTGINTSQNGVAFGEFNLLYNIDSPRLQPGDSDLTQIAYILNPYDGTKFDSKPLTPPTAAALGDFRPGTNLYYGLNFDTAFPPPFPTSIWVVDPLEGTWSKLGNTVPDLHTLTFIKGIW